MSPDDPAPLFTLFWENSKLNRHTARAFAEQLDEDTRTAPRAPRLHYPELAPLPRPDDPLFAAMARRESRRAFSPAPLDARQLGSLFAAFAARPDPPPGESPGRLLPSAGARHPIEVFAFLFRAAAPHGGQIVHYLHEAHALSTVAPCPSWAACSADFALALDGEPAALFVLAALPERTTARYAERGGRFVLLEAGHHAQNLALRAAHEGLAGVLAGGLHDDRVRAHLRLDRTDALILLGYACGPPG